MAQHAHRIAAVAAALLLTLGACGGDDDDGDAATGGDGTTTAAPEATGDAGTTTTDPGVDTTDTTSSIAGSAQSVRVVEQHLASAHSGESWYASLHHVELSGDTLRIVTTLAADAAGANDAVALCDGAAMVAYGGDVGARAVSIEDTSGTVLAAGADGGSCEAA